MDTDLNLKRTMGVGIATLTLVGYVIGPAIFILPGQLARQTGPGLFVAYILAVIPAIFACVVTAEVADSFPTSGAGYVAVSRVLSPFWGFMMVWTVIGLVGVGVPLLAYGFAQYLGYFIPGVNQMMTALAVVALFTVINVLGVKLAEWVQAAMVIEMILALVFFAVGGLAHGNSALMKPLFPQGLVPVLIASVPAYISYTGFMVLAEISGEIRDPARSVPRSLALALFIVFVIYVSVPLALTHLLPWSSFDGTTPAVGLAAKVFLPGWLADVISLTALIGAATSIHGVLLIQSRDVFAMARDRVLPAFFGRVSPRFGAPVNAVLLLGAISAVGVLLGQSITSYAIMTVLGFMIVQILVGSAMWTLPRRLPDVFASRSWQPGPVVRGFFNGGLIFLSLVYAVIGVTQSAVSTLVYLGFVALGGAYYVWRRKALLRSGYDIAKALRANRQIGA
ncbi:MAG: APC family permease [Bacillota bacterium]